MQPKFWRAATLKIGRVELADLLFGELILMDVGRFEDELLILCQGLERAVRGGGGPLALILFRASSFEEELDG